MQGDYSLWLMPQRATAEYWRAVIVSLAQRLNAPPFEPHITLLGNVATDFSTLDQWVGDTASALPPLDLTITRPTKLSAYYRCVLMEIHLSQALYVLRHRAVQRFGSREEVYYPHMSLLYGEYDAHRKDVIIEELQKSGYSKTLHIDRMSVMKMSDRVEDWKIMQEYPLGA